MNAALESPISGFSGAFSGDNNYLFDDVTPGMPVALSVYMNTSTC